MFQIGVVRPPYIVYTCNSCRRLTKRPRDDDVRVNLLRCQNRPAAIVGKKDCKCFEMSALTKDIDEHAFRMNVVDKIMQDKLLCEEIENRHERRAAGVMEIQRAREAAGQYKHH